VKFSGYPDGIGTVSEVPFSVLIPYNEAIVNFSLYDSSNMRLWDLEVDNAVDVSGFSVTENEYGFNLSWSGAEGLTYDVTAISEISGLRSVLLFRSENTYIDIPFEWLEPNDTIIFELSAYSGNGTSITLSESFVTPDGAAALIGDADGDEWGYEYDYSDYPDGDLDPESSDPSLGDYVIFFVVIAVIGGIIIVPVIIIVVVVTKNKKNNGVKEVKEVKEVNEVNEVNEV
jgi:hypothetical protein